MVTRIKEQVAQRELRDDHWTPVAHSDLRALLAVIETVQKYRDGLPEEIVLALQDLDGARG
ncbi:MAG TPA: hypothetical protein VNH41_03450 [Steroidobacteraceae bacterium]|nr:hypothetical protein [Steroidobacteraceae bacterium]